VPGDAVASLWWGMSYGALGMPVFLAAVIALVTRQRPTLSYAGAMWIVLGLVVLVDQRLGTAASGIGWVHGAAVAAMLMLGAGLTLHIGRVRRARERLERALQQRVAEERQRLVEAQVDWLAEEHEAHLLEPQWREEERHLRRRAYTDPLLDVPNRRYIEEHWGSRPGKAAAAGRVLAVLVLRVTELDGINRRSGRWAGDLALLAFAAQLKALLAKDDGAEDGRRGERYGRLEGAHFLVLSPAVGSMQAADRWARLLTAALKRAGELTAEDEPGDEIGVEVGVAFCPVDGSSLADLIARAHARIGMPAEQA
jgi:diguanylate cyclase (GGDEF)-like protein